MTRLVPLLLILASCGVRPARFPLEFSLARLERDVRFLASDEMKGRNNGTPEGAAAADHVARRMEEAGLKPAGENGTWFQVIPGRRGDRGRNVIGARPGLSGRWIVIGAHHDGLGVVRDKIHNGADDNASGVAVILEVARRIEGKPLHHGLLFCSFDAEEDGLTGSSHFVKSNLYPVESFVAMICLDLVGGSFLPGDEKRVFALGSESSARLFEWIGNRRDRPGPLEVERAGIYAIEPMGPAIARSDYSAFRLKKVPFVFFSTGTPWYYHTPEDDVERLDFAKMEHVADLVTNLASDLVRPSPATEWREPEPDVAEDARLLAAGCSRALEHPAIKLSDRQRTGLGQAMEALQGQPDKGTVQRAMMALFTLAAAQRPAH
ncbi:MAG TPA: M28 family peptidase [Planctomycetota bacterium]|nr:M28 family peptidase [Planctomycetota bacterium]